MVAALRRDRLTIPEIEEIASPTLARILGDFGFGNVEAAEDQDFDGAPIIRMTAKVQARVPAKAVIDSLDAVRTELLRYGEERFVMFHTQMPETDEPQEDELDQDDNG